jgi:hypothetical protein
MGEMRNAYKILVGKPGRKRPLERPRCKWEDNINVELRERWWKLVNGIRDEPSWSIKGEELLDHQSDRLYRLLIGNPQGQIQLERTRLSEM